VKTIENILTNEKYTGTSVYGDVEFQNKELKIGRNSHVL
jgi:hypothetical protein